MNRNRAARARVTKKHRIDGLGESIGEGDVLLIVPPFATLKHPTLGVHLLQGCARQAGFRVQVVYATVLLASLMGEENYGQICDAPMGSFAAERFFARAAFNLPPLGRRARQMFEPAWLIETEEEGEIGAGSAPPPDLDLRTLKRLEKDYAQDFVETVAKRVSESSYKIVGCTTMFEQTTASVALLNRIKRFNKDIVTILGGANCEGEMARGLVSVGAEIDYIFSGESEAVFPAFIETILAGKRPRQQIIQGNPCRQMDTLPTPRFAEFYEQRTRHLPVSRVRLEETEIPYETSRGCWWGEKQHCTFCGLNGEGMAFREKSPARVVEELSLLVRNHPTRKIVMTDNIMPHSYFKTLLPQLTENFSEIDIYYEQKANLSLPKVLALKRAGITSIEAGIEGLSSRLLTLMRKGVPARQNLALLRYAKSVGIHLTWNLLWGFPGDEADAYEETLALAPLLHHLPPPTGMWHLSIARFSPYFARPEEYGVKQLRPLAAYSDFLPERAEVEKVAYHFAGDYKSGAHQHLGVIRKLERAIADWQAAWKRKDGGPGEELTLSPAGGGYELSDTRKLAQGKKVYRLDERKASFLVTPRISGGSELEAWAVGKQLAVITDGWFTPLAVAEPKLLLELMERDAAAVERRGVRLPIVGRGGESGATGRHAALACGSESGRENRLE